MHTDAVLRLEGIHKTFKLYSTPADRLIERLTGAARHREHAALRGVSLEVAPGETVGVLGCNGAGKSTLLKIILGVLKPDAGTLAALGCITGLLELGTGFDPQLTGRQNIHVNGLLMGVSATELKAREPEIIAFAELGDYIDEPLRTYSSGMMMRLGFSVSIHAKPRCFVVDEALAVGDARFQRKCFDWVRKFTREGGAILLVSHDLNAIRMLCTRTVVLDRGRIVFNGAPDAAGRAYYRILGGEAPEDPGSPSWGKKQVHLQRVAFVDAAGYALESISAGSDARLRLDIRANVTRDLTVGFMIKDRMGQELFGTNSALLGHSIRVHAGQCHRIEFTFPVHLGPGAYSISVALHGGATHDDDCEHWIDTALSFRVDGYLGYHCVGLLWQPVSRLEVHQLEQDTSDET